MRTAPKKTTTKQYEFNEKFNDILNVINIINYSTDIASTLQLVSDHITNLLNAQLASVFILDHEKNQLWSLASKDGAHISFDARLGLAGAAASKGELINVPDAYEDKRFYQRVDKQTGQRTKSILIVPLKNSDGQVIGTFQVLNKKKGTFNRVDEELMKILAESVSASVQKSQLIGDLMQRNADLIKENISLRRDFIKEFSTQNIIGESPQIQTVVRTIEQISDTSLNVLITGETGTGKELTAKAIHYSSSRSREPLVSINCAAIPDSLIETELFGIEKGVATGVEPRIGKFEDAGSGTLFLDEIGDLSLAAQSKMLRVLQERVIQHVGGRKLIPVNARILAATNKDLESEIKKGRFREDLYYRLKEIQIHMPSLRDIPEDIPLIINHLINKHSKKGETKKISTETMNSLTGYEWPGNVRELENIVKHLILLTPRKLINKDDLPEKFKIANQKNITLRSVHKFILKDKIEKYEKEIIIQALESSKNNQIQTAKLLGLSRQGLINKMKRYGLVS